MKKTAKKLKRALACMLAVVMVLCAVPMSGSAVSTRDGYYTYMVTDAEAIIIDVDTSINGDVVIPDTLGGYSVTCIDDGAFRDCLKLTSIIIPNSVKNIGKDAFNSCEQLESIVLPERIKSIGEGAFYGCVHFTDIVIPDGVTSIEHYTFMNCNNLTSVIIPESVTNIESDAFCGCTSLLSVTLPNSVKSIGSGAFSGCYSLTSVTIPESVTEIGENAFGVCYGIESIFVDQNNECYSSEDGVLFNKDMTILIQYPMANDRTNYIIPSSVTKIGNGAFFAVTPSQTLQSRTA